VSTPSESAVPGVVSSGRPLVPVTGDDGVVDDGVGDHRHLLAGADRPLDGRFVVDLDVLGGDVAADVRDGSSDRH
jgi:hypothetical protein